MCECMNISKSSCYHWAVMVDRPKIITGKMHLKERTRIVLEGSGCIYGSYRVQKMLEREGLEYPGSYIAVLMRPMGLKSILRRKYVIRIQIIHSQCPAISRIEHLIALG